MLLRLCRQAYTSSVPTYLNFTSHLITAAAAAAAAAAASPTVHLPPTLQKRCWQAYTSSVYKYLRFASRLITAAAAAAAAAAVHWAPTLQKRCWHVCTSSVTQYLPSTSHQCCCCCCCVCSAFGSHVAEKVLAGLHQQAEQLMAADAEEHGAAGFDEDAEDGNAAAAGTLEGLLGSMVGAIGEL
jgi:hypothetical protein